MENDNLKSVTESLYKQNLELAVKNKTLSLLSKLYEISVLTLNPRELAKKITTVIQIDLNFELVGVLLYDQEKDELFPLSFSESDRFYKTQTDLNVFSVNIPSVSENVFLKKVVEQKIMAYTEELRDIWDSLVPAEMFNKVKSDSNVQSSILYPLIIENKVIGVLLLSLNRIYSDLIEYEKESIRTFVNVIAVALDKALLYEQLENTNTKLKEANEGQASLMHFMNHQVKGRFGNAKNIFAELLTNDYGQMPDFAKPLLEKGLEETKMGVDYVQNILRGASAENGTLPYDMKLINMKTIVEEVFLKQKEYAEKRWLNFNLQIEPGDYNITGDAIQLGEAVKNMIDNSINYTKEGSIAVALSVSDKKIQLKVKDTGIGIASEDKDKLFKPGGRGMESLKINVNSTGYGLAFVKGVVEAHKGRVWAESEGSDKGSVFYIELPKT